MLVKMVTGGGGGGNTPPELIKETMSLVSNTYTISDLTEIRAVYIQYSNEACFGGLDSTDTLMASTTYSYIKVTAISGNTFTFSSTLGSAISCSVYVMGY